MTALISPSLLSKKKSNEKRSRMFQKTLTEKWTHLVSRLRNTLINLGATFCQNLVLMSPIDPVIPAKAGIRSFQWVLDSGWSPPRT
jgi:hypothetical protein